jgi:hypothetical protein
MMMSNTKRASMNQVLKFCNKVRKAGGADPIGALLPAEPEQVDACLIAVNLNHECEIYRRGSYRTGPWVMWCDKPVAEKLAKKLKLKLVREEGAWGVQLPPEIGAVARDYDDWWDALSSGGECNAKDKADFWPLVSDYCKEGLMNYGI